MAVVENNAVDVRGCPATARFEAAAADQWIEVLLDYAKWMGANRVAVQIAGGGKLAHAVIAGAAVDSSVGGDDYHPLPDGLTYYMDFDRHQPLKLFVAADNANSDVFVHVTREWRYSGEERGKP